MLAKIRLVVLMLVAVVLLGIPLAVLAQDKPQVDVWLYDDELSQCVRDVWTTGFNTAERNVEVNVVLQPNVDDAVRTALAAGSGPDIVPAGGPAYVLEYAGADLLLPLDDYATQNGWDQIFVPWALGLGQVDGHLYSLPDSLETLVIWYNKTLFEQNGWQVPQTMDELFTLAQTIQDAGVVPFANAYGDFPPGHELFVAAFLNHYAGPDKVHQALTGQIPWTDPAFVEAITKLNDMVQQGWVDGSVDLMFTDSFDTVNAMLGSGEGAMMLDGSWADLSDYFGEAAGNDNDYDWFPIPTTTGDEMYVTGIGAVWGINKNSDNPDAAAEFLTWMFSPEAQAARYLQCSYAVAPVQISAEALEGADPRNARIYAAYGQAAADGRYGYTTYTFWPPDTEAYLSEEIQKVYLGTVTPEGYMQGMEDRFGPELEANAVPPIPPREP
jgi:raffinose/stachyose/melibiose transport system substrate-binding protein